MSSDPHAQKEEKSADKPPPAKNVTFVALPAAEGGALPPPLPAPMAVGTSPAELGEYNVGVMTCTYDSGDFEQVIALAKNALSTVHDDRIPLRYVAVMLRLLGRSFVQLREVEYARSTYAMLKQVIEKCDVWAPGESRPQRDRCRDLWLIRHDRDCAIIEEADGHREEAIAMYTSAWYKQARCFGPESPEALDTYVTIANVRSQLNDTTTALKMLQQAEAVAAVQPSGDCLALWVHVSLSSARMHARLRRNCDAANKVEGVIEVLEGAIQQLRPPTASAIRDGRTRVEQLHSISAQTTEAGLWVNYTIDLTEALLLSGDLRAASSDYAEALSRYEEARSVASRVIAPTDLTVIRIELKIAVMEETLASSGIAASSIEKIERLLAILQQRSVWGQQHTNVLFEVHEALGEMYSHRGEHEKAARNFEKALSASKMLFAPDHEVSASLQHKWGEALLMCGRAEEALYLFSELREWIVACPTNRMPPLPLFVVAHSLGNAMRCMERFDEAMAFYQEALGSEGCSSDCAARILGNMAAVRRTVGDIDGAISYNREALCHRKRALGDHHLDVAASHGNLAELLFESKLYKDALWHSEQCIRIVEHNFLEKKDGRALVDAHPYFRKASKLRAECTRIRKGQEYKRITNLSTDSSVRIKPA